MPKSARAADLIRRDITVPAIKAAAAEQQQLKDNRSAAMKPISVTTTSRKLKVTMVLEPSAFVGLAVPDGAPRADVVVSVAGRTVVASIAAKSLRKAVKTIAEHGADNVAMVLQGNLEVDGTLSEGGLSAQVKARQPPAGEAA